MLACAATEVHRFPGLIRRFCSCGKINICVCGLPQTNSGWTVESLTRLRLSMQEHGSVQVAAFELGETVHRCNVALNELLGRTPQHALAALEARQ